MNTDKSAKGQNWISEGLLIAFLPVVSYAVVFANEAGYASFFGIPLEFIEISLTNTIIALFSLLLLALISFGPVVTLGPLWRKLPKPIRARLTIYIPSFLLYIASLVAFGKQLSPLFNIAIAFIAVMILLDFILPILRSDDKRSYLERFDYFAKLESNHDSSTDSIVNAKTVHFIVLFFLIVFILWFSFCIGRFTAKNSTKFYVIEGQNETVVLRKYGDVMLAARVNELTKEVSQEYSVYKINSDKMLTVRVKRIGRLTLAPENKPQQHLTLAPISCHTSKP